MVLHQLLNLSEPPRNEGQQEKHYYPVNIPSLL